MILKDRRGDSHVSEQLFNICLQWAAYHLFLTNEYLGKFDTNLKMQDNYGIAGRLYNPNRLYTHIIF